MEKTRTLINIAGQELRLSGDESEQYLRELADDVNSRIFYVQRQYPTLGVNTCVLLACMNMADELAKLRADYDALDKRISQLREIPASAAPVKRPFETRQKTNT